MVDGGGVAAEASLFAALREYPLGAITVALAIFLIAIFFVTGADAASIVMGMLSQNGAEEPRRHLVIFWGVATGAVAAVLLGSAEDGRGGLQALQTLVILVAAPVHADPDRHVRVPVQGAPQGAARRDARARGSGRRRARRPLPGWSLST